MDDKDVLMELWKKTVDVQQHFNDIELRIRNIAIALLASVLGVAAVAFREGRPLVACLVCGAGLVALLAFFLMDYLWYHQLLRGAVEYGKALEARIADLAGTAEIPAEGLTGAIGRTSAYRIPMKWWLPFLRGKELHSSTKMRMFYGLFATAMLIGAIVSGADAVLGGGRKPEQVQRVEATVVVRDTVYVALPTAALRIKPIMRGSSERKGAERSTVSTSSAR